MLFERGVRDHLSFIIHNRITAAMATPGSDETACPEFVQLLSKICPKLPETG